MEPARTIDAEGLRLLFNVAQTLLAERDYGELLADLLDATIAEFGAERGCVVVHEAGNFRVAVARNFRSDSLAAAEHEVSTSIAAEVAGKRRALLLGDALGSTEFGENPSVKRMALRSVLCAPLVASDEAFALIYLENRDVANRFTERHRELLQQVCQLSGPRLRTAVHVEHARRRARELETGIGASDGILTADAGMTAVLATLRQVAATELPVLIQGETGTGKELLARALYRQSPRSSGPFVVLNCAAIPATLVESELFGYVRGAFTGAMRDRIGLLAAAHRGTLFLDEIGELPLELQPRLLRALQSGEYTRLGAVQPEIADIRCVAATNRDLLRDVEAGNFREDLYYRLSAVTLKVPPLRERPHDVYLLTDHFLRAYAGRYGKPLPRLSQAAMQLLATYSFPGNVRELESEIARLVAISPAGAEIPADALGEQLRAPSQAAPTDDAALPQMSLEEMEKRLIRSVLKSTDGNRTRAAEILGISREGLRTKMQRLGLSDGN